MNGECDLYEREAQETQRFHCQRRFHNQIDNLEKMNLENEIQRQKFVEEKRLQQHL